MAAMLVCAVMASMAGLIVPPVLKIMRLDPQGRMALKPLRTAFAPD